MPCRGKRYPGGGFDATDFDMSPGGVSTPLTAGTMTLIDRNTLHFTIDTGRVCGAGQHRDLPPDQHSSRRLQAGH
jgi:hypothetical protein